jgi:hypothetical protein
MTSLKQSPFYLLGASIRDDRRRIVELAEEKTLTLDTDVCTKARNDLTTPRNRLAVEMAWLPGVSPNAARTLVDNLHNHLGLARKASTAHALAKANLLAAAIELLDSEMDVDVWCDWIIEFAYTVDMIEPEDVLRDINEERSVSGFPEVKGIEQIGIELRERQRYYTEAIKTVLNKFSPDKLVEVVTRVVETTTDTGEEHGASLVHDLIERYEVDANRYLQPEAENIKKLSEAILQAAPQGESSIKPLVDKLIQVVSKWDIVAQPIQISARARGLNHDLSHEVANVIRSLGIDLFNQHNMIDTAKRFTRVLQELFAELPEIVEKLDQDSTTLGDIAAKRDQEKLLVPLTTLCKVVIQTVDNNPLQGELEGARALQEGRLLISKIPAKVTSDIMHEAKNVLAGTVMHCAIEYGNKTAKWGDCVNLLENAFEVAFDTDLKQQIKKNLDVAVGNAESLRGLEPIKSAPSLSTINGIGCTLYGSTEHDISNGSHMATYYFVLFAIPIFPIARYRVIPTPGGYRFLGKAPLRTMDKWHIAISVGLIIWIFAH